EEDATMSGSRCNRLTRRSVGIVLATIFLVVGTAGGRAHAPTAAGCLVVGSGDCVGQNTTRLPLAKGRAGFSVFDAAKDRPHGITCSYTGSGASAFLTRIDDVANEGGGGAKKNWQLWVNTSYADRSFSVYEVQPLDVVFWRFATQEGK